MNEEIKTQTNDWIKKEVEMLKETAFDGERKPSLKLEENKVITMTINFSEPFQRWEDKENNIIKKIIPVKVNGEELVWWLNVKNPIYGEIIKKGSEGQTEFKVMQTGSQKNTKYNLIEE
ncbi:MAG: hypothetical protein ACTSUG_00240 [Candidatus Helarchaeota archaeon]